jgi:acetyl-CoA carboxylase biotin carboxyl carrier protein
VATDPKPVMPRPFDVKTVEHLIALMSQHDLTEISLCEGDLKIRLRKGGTAPVFVPAPQAAFGPPPASPSNPHSNTTSAPVRNLIDIKSEMVGTFYSRPDPKKDEFVKVGSKVKPDTTVCLIEAMKIYNEIKADCTGTIVEVCVQDKEPVDFGTILFRVDPQV